MDPNFSLVYLDGCKLFCWRILVGIIFRMSPIMCISDCLIIPIISDSRYCHSEDVSLSFMRQVREDPIFRNVKAFVYRCYRWKKVFIHSANIYYLQGLVLGS